MPDLTSYNAAVELGKKKDAINAALANISTTAALVAIADPINTVGKFLGKRVINTTTGTEVWASGPLAADVWKKTADGTTAHTPA